MQDNLLQRYKYNANLITVKEVKHEINVHAVKTRYMVYV